MSRSMIRALTILVAGAAPVMAQSGVPVRDYRTLPATVPEIRLSANPELSFAGDPRDSSALQGNMAIRRLRDGRFVVHLSYTGDTSGGRTIAQARVSELRIYSPAGVLLDRGGRAGNQPGQLGTPSLLGVLPGDSIVVATAGRLPAVFSPELEFVREFPRPTLDFIAQPRGMLADGTVVVDFDRGSTPDSFPSQMHMARVTTEVWTWKSSPPMHTALFSLPRQVVRPGRSASPQGALSGDGRYGAVRVTDSYNPATLPQPLPINPRSFVGARGSTIWSFDPEKWELTIRDETGRPLTLVRPPIPWPNEGATYGNLVPREQTGLVSIIVGEDGRTWIEQIPRGGTHREFLALSSSGALEGIARMPVGFSPGQFGADFVSGIRADASGRAVVTVYRLDR